MSFPEQTILKYGASATAIAVNDEIIRSGTLGHAGNLSGLLPVGLEIGPNALPAPNPAGHGSLYFRSPATGTIRVFTGEISVGTGTAVTLGGAPVIHFQIWRAASTGNNNLNQEVPPPAASGSLPDLSFAQVADIPIPIAGPTVTPPFLFAGTQEFLDIPVAKDDYIAVQILLEDITTSTPAIGATVSISAGVLIKHATAL